MGVMSKYQMLIDEAKKSGVAELQIAEQNGILYIRGIAPTADVKNKLWDIYNQIDPNFFSGEVVLDIVVSPDVVGTKVRVVTESTALNIRKGPGIEQPIIGQAAKGEVITLLNRANSLWWLIRTVNGIEGYCYAEYLEPIK